MLVGMRQFIDALHKAIKGESIPGDMSEENVNTFAKKLCEFAGLQMDGVQEILMEAKDRELCGRQAQEAAKRARNRWRKQKRFQYTMLK